VIISTQCQYALQVVHEITRSHHGSGVTMGDIAKVEGCRLSCPVAGERRLLTVLFKETKSTK